MGFPNSSHIKKFVAGKTIKDFRQEEDAVVIEFTDGELLRMYDNGVPEVKPRHEFICTPFRADGEVKQSTEIERSNAGVTGSGEKI
jgi:hypothetical protein